MQYLMQPEMLVLPYQLFLRRPVMTLNLMTQRKKRLELCKFGIKRSAIFQTFLLEKSSSF